MVPGVSSQSPFEGAAGRERERGGDAVHLDRAAGGAGLDRCKRRRCGRRRRGGSFFLGVDWQAGKKGGGQHQDVSETRFHGLELGMEQGTDTRKVVGSFRLWRPDCKRGKPESHGNPGL